MSLVHNPQRFLDIISENPNVPKSNRLHIRIFWFFFTNLRYIPRAMTMKFWEPKRKHPKAIPRHLQDHVVWLLILKYSVKSYVAGLSTMLFQQPKPHWSKGGVRVEWNWGLYISTWGIDWMCPSPFNPWMPWVMGRGACSWHIDSSPTIA